MINYVLAFLFPYRLPSKLGMMLVCQKMITDEPGSALRN